MRVQGDDSYVTSMCPACGDVMDCCLGHGEMADPEGRRILNQHDEGDHSNCNPRGCEDANHE